MLYKSTFTEQELASQGWEYERNEECLECGVFIVWYSRIRKGKSQWLKLTEGLMEVHTCETRNS